MRTLKKTLALVLVLAMALSLCAFGVSADFTDTTDSDYTEAIDVLSGIGVINGMTATTFDPDGSLTREQAAKIIAYLMLGPVNAELVSGATTSSFADVAADRWSAGYIEYCANLGILAGVGDNNFDPTGTLTTAAFTKMLLCALGYNAETEGLTGSSWAINTAALAVGAGVYDSTIGISATAVCTREQACQLAYATLTATTVKYTGGTSMTVNGVTIITGGTLTQIANTTSDYTGVVDNVMQFCESHFSTLKYSVSSANAFGRPVYNWKLGATTIGSYATVAPVASWTANLQAATDITVVTALTGYTVNANTPVYINGETGTTVSTVADIKALTNNGTLVEVYADTSKVVTRVVVVKTVIGSVTAKDVDAKTVTVSDGTNSVTLSAVSSTVAFGGAYAALYAMAVDAKVLLVENVSGGAITKILSYATPTTASGTYTSVAAGVYTIGGTAYGLSENETFTAPSLGATATVYLDTYGYIIANGTTTTSTTYALALSAVKEGNVMSGYTYYAQLLFADGTISWVQFNTYGGATTATALDNGVTAINGGADFVAYSSTGSVYALTEASANDALSADTVTNNSPSFNGYIASSSTVFVINTGTATAPVYKAYTGISSVPTTTGDGFGLRVSGVYKMVVFTGTTATASADLVYIYNGTEIGSTYVSSTVTTETFLAIVNGVKTTVAANTTLTLGQGMYIGNTYAASGYISAIAGTPDSSTGITANKSFSIADKSKVFKATTTDTNGTAALSEGVLSVVADNAGSAISVTGVVDGSFTRFMVDTSDGTCTTKTLSSTAFDMNAGTVYFVIDASGFVDYAIIVVA